MLLTTESSKIKVKYRALAPRLDQRALYLWAAVEADALGIREAVSLVAKATGLSRRNIHAGLSELQKTDPPPRSSTRRPGAGRKTKTFHHPELLARLEELFEPASRGDSPLRWTSKSLAALAGELGRLGIDMGRQTVDSLLNRLGYSLQAHQRSFDGRQHPRRDSQFERVNACVAEGLKRNIPVLAVNSRKIGTATAVNAAAVAAGTVNAAAKTELSGDALAETSTRLAYPVWPQEPVRPKEAHSPGAANFVPESVCRWWRMAGQAAYAGAERLVLVIDPLAANGSRPRRWRQGLESLAPALGLAVSAHFLPPVTFRWNRPLGILASCPARDWRGKRLPDYETAVCLFLRPEADQPEAGFDRSEADQPDPEPEPESIFLAKDQGRPGRGDEWNWEFVPCA